MPDFSPHPQLEADSIFVRDLALCQLRLMNRMAAPWLLLVPRRAELREIHELDTGDRAMLIEEIAQASKTIEELCAPDKINIGALGNIVPQLHIHVIARFKGDAAWPEPVWGRISPEPYPEEVAAEFAARLKDFWKD